MLLFLLFKGVGVVVVVGVFEAAWVVVGCDRGEGCCCFKRCGLLPFSGFRAVPFKEVSVVVFSGG